MQLSDFVALLDQVDTEVEERAADTRVEDPTIHFISWILRIVIVSINSFNGVLVLIIF